MAILLWLLKPLQFVLDIVLRIGRWVAVAGHLSTMEAGS